MANVNIMIIPSGDNREQGEQTKDRSKEKYCISDSNKSMHDHTPLKD
jgi:hypothetical protein